MDNKEQVLSQLTALDLIFHLSKHNIWKTKVWGGRTRKSSKQPTKNLYINFRLVHKIYDQKSITAETPNEKESRNYQVMLFKASFYILLS